MHQSQRVSAHEIDIALKSPWWKLKLPDGLENVFEAETSLARCRDLTAFGMGVLAFYDLFLLVDLRLIPDIFYDAVLMRLGVVTPLALVMVIVLRSNPPVALRESMEAAITVVVTASILWLMLASRSPLSVYHSYGIVLVILFANVVQRIRFWYAMAASLASFAIYVVAMVKVPGLPTDGRLMAITVLGSVILFTLATSHTLERSTRRNFLLSLRDRQRHDELEEIARRDPLTGLGNRRQLDDTLNALWPRAQADGENIALLMLDIDKFKPFNDCYGHLAGDTCLKRVSAVVAAELRGPQDVAARFGGEELVMVLGDMDLSEGIRIAERIRRAIEAVAIPHEASRRGIVTVSIGVTAGIPSPELTQHDFLEAADAALYAAKRNGRNQVWPPLLAANHGASADSTNWPATKAG